MKIHKIGEYKYSVNNGWMNFGYRLTRYHVTNLKDNVTLFTTGSYDDIKDVMNYIISENKEPDSYPTPKENKPQLFIYDSKHYVSHFIVKNIDDVKKVMIKILKDEYSLENIHNRYSDICIYDGLPQEEISKISVDSVRLKLQYELNTFIKNNKEKEMHNLCVDQLKKVISDEDADVISVFDYFEERELKKIDEY